MLHLIVLIYNIIKVKIISKLSGIMAVMEIFQDHFVQMQERFGILHQVLITLSITPQKSWKLRLFYLKRPTIELLLKINLNRLITCISLLSNIGKEWKNYVKKCQELCKTIQIYIFSCFKSAQVPLRYLFFIPFFLKLKGYSLYVLQYFAYFI